MNNSTAIKQAFLTIAIGTVYTAESLEAAAYGIAKTADQMTLKLWVANELKAYFA